MSKLKVKYLAIFPNPLFMDGFWNDYQIMLYAPSYQDLCWRFAILFCYRYYSWMVKPLCSGQWTVSFKLNIVFVAES
jgi:hypothetical protein